MEDWKIHPKIWVFACGFNMTVFHHTTVMKSVNVCTKSILDNELVMNMKHQFSDLHSHLTWILSKFVCWVSDEQGLTTQLLLERNCRVKFNILHVNQSIYQRSSNTCNFPLHTKPRGVFTSMKAIVSPSCKKTKTNHFLYMLQLVKPRTTESVTTEIKIKKAATF